ncbi:pPIWI-associating nuclease domain-containing protein [Sphingobacterium wenxiniae]|uniref:Predicted pPIWI-associating nuclease domain-containing protein n=1 Tax=Sphingobacterium wenxiniae TaxID=683125 RepID=A0A1I6THC6_9SPHI|nr:hypothetical protein [Sphingobacterium wenxiniae]SFS88593.1 hypothetical protein SAMN05660206_106151 [Sphingobacterium wenxiniae]
MAKRISTAKLSQAINKYNQAVRKYNSAVKKSVNDYNRLAQQHNTQVKRNIENYNRAVRKFNTDQRTRRQKLNHAISSFNSIKHSSNISTSYTNSVERLEKSYDNLNYYNESNQRNSNIFVDYPLQETQNSLELYNALNNPHHAEITPTESLQNSYIHEELTNISFDLGDRWKGALFSLNPSNPDASRHFCTSVREIFTLLLDIKAPDQMVLNRFPDCELYNSSPTRRTKIKYVLTENSIHSDELISFLDADINEILSLFRTLNDGTHGNSGKFNTTQLSLLKQRTEDALAYMIEL